MIKVYTCAPMPFVADDAFFTRDSGLLCRQFRALGVESKVVMPALGSNESTDPADVIRATKSQFVDPLWWKSLDIDAVVFVTWGFPEHTSVIRAARDAGIRTCAIFETGGNSYPYGGFLSTIVTFWRKGKFVEAFPKRFAGTAARAVAYTFSGLVSCYHRSVQIGIPHLATFDSPSAMSRCLDTMKFFPWLDVNSEASLVGYPTPDFFSPARREERRTNVVAIARWDAIRHKRPHMLMHMSELLLKSHPTVTIEIFGRLIPALEQWHANLDASVASRVSLLGIQPSQKVARAIGTSQVLYCPSAGDGIPLVVIEGLCGGCSVAGLKTLDVPALYWAGSEGDGSLVPDDSVESNTRAVLAELEAWEENRRDPMAISEKWKHWFSADQVSRRLLKLLFPDGEAAS